MINELDLPMALSERVRMMEGILIATPTGESGDNSI